MTVLRRGVPQSEVVSPGVLLPGRAAISRVAPCCFASSVAVRARLLCEADRRSRRRQGRPTVTRNVVAAAESRGNSVRARTARTKELRDRLMQDSF